ncbi:hypothetical protein V6N12_069258 [Hibiscus sabdariffa]|uniref:Uncharacterized protein n=1 Tax=Hibiscus sabdariffa TaxID=183260 RepID=A0ABR2FDD6_9ROSI
MTVNAMVTQSGEWDWQTLNLVLPYHVLQHIAVVLPPRLGLGNDLPSWRWETDKHFSIKSAYQSLVNVEESINNIDWKMVWKLAVLHPSSARNPDKWSIRFPVFCWQLWKHRCSVIFDATFVECGDFLDRCNRLTNEYASAAATPARTVSPNSVVNSCQYLPIELSTVHDIILHA